MKGEKHQLVPGELVRLNVPFYTDVAEDSIGIILEHPQDSHNPAGKGPARVLFSCGTTDWFPRYHLSRINDETR